MFTKRLISGIILVLLAMIVLYQGGIFLYATMMAISLIGMYELYRVLQIEKKALSAVGYLTAFVYYLLVWFDGQHYTMLTVIAALMLLMGLYVFTFPRYKTEEVTGAFFGIFYVAVMLSYLYQVRTMTDGIYFVWLIVISSWGCDTCAYCAGVTFGKHKLVPVLSPKKTIEGAVGGALGSLLLGFLFAFLFGAHLTELKTPYLTCGLACLIAALISQVGDLAASAIKRNHGIKDYGTLIPGHGGILDRFDSVLFTAPAIYFALTFLK